MTMAAVIGALPIAVGYGAYGDNRKSLGMVIVGGLIISLPCRPRPQKPAKPGILLSVMPGLPTVHELCFLGLSAAAYMPYILPLE
jgi:hypothetical protein